MTTAPGNLPSAISFFSIEVMRPSRSGDIPTCSGVAVARGWSSRAQTGSDTVVATTIAANAVVAANIFHLDMTFPPWTVLARTEFARSGNDLIRHRRLGTCFRISDKYR